MTIGRSTVETVAYRRKLYRSDLRQLATAAGTRARLKRILNATTIPCR